MSSDALRIVAIVFLGTVFQLPTTAWAQDDVADVRAKEYVLDEAGQQRYFLIAAKGKPTKPKDGFKLLVVLPGGDGSVEFQPFVKRIYKHALSRDYLVIQVIAPKWSPQQRIVWPTTGSRVPNMRVPTEKIVSSAIEDLRQRTTLDERRILLLGWSSGGPAAYAVALGSNSPVTGSYIAMSVFKPRDLPPLKNGKGRAFYLRHSPDDRVCPYRMAESARDQLSQAGAKVTLATYEGGHGWRGNVFGAIRDGIAWLEKETRE